MKPRWALISAALLAAPTLARAGEPSAPPVTIEPPPGWADASGRGQIEGAIITLKGPESSSFVVARAVGAPRDSAAGSRTYLMKLIGGIRAGSGLDFRAHGAVETRAFRNGVGVQLLRANLDGKPRLVVALVDAGGPPLVATLSSAAPDAMLTPLFGALHPAADEGAVRSTGLQRSLDDQFEVALGGGLRARALSAVEKSRGAVLALQGAGSEVVFLKLSGEESAPKDQPGIVRATVADEVKAPLDAVPAARLAATPAGPAAVYARARESGSPDLRFAAGFLPWQYWGYSVLARGPQADELLVGSLAALKTGPAAVPKLVADTPRLELPDAGDAVGRYGPAAAVLLVLAALVWSLTRKKGNLAQ